MGKALSVKNKVVYIVDGQVNRIDLFSVNSGENQVQWALNIIGNRQKIQDEYEFELSRALLERMIKTARQDRNLTQEHSEKLVGGLKPQISKLDSSTNSLTIDTIINEFKVDIYFNVALEKQILLA